MKELGSYTAYQQSLADERLAKVAQEEELLVAGRIHFGLPDWLHLDGQQRELVVQHMRNKLT